MLFHYFFKLSHTSIFTKETKDKLSKIDEDMKESAHQLSLDPSHSFAHYSKIRNLQEKLLKEEASIRPTLAKIQGMILLDMDALQKHIAHAKKLTHDKNFSIVDHMMELLAEVQIALHAIKILQGNWDKTMVLIVKVHSKFLSHFCIIIQLLYTFGIYVKNGEK